MNVAGRFGYAATWLDLTRPALRRLGQPGAPFEALTGALSLLGQVIDCARALICVQSTVFVDRGRLQANPHYCFFLTSSLYLFFLVHQDRLIKHVTSQWHLTNGFLRLFFKAPLAVAALPEAAQDKRQRLQVPPYCFSHTL